MRGAAAGTLAFLLLLGSAARGEERPLILLAIRGAASISFSGAPLWGGGLSGHFGKSWRVGAGTNRFLVAGRLEVVGGASVRDLSYLRVGFTPMLGGEVGRVRILGGPHMGGICLFSPLYRAPVSTGLEIGAAAQVSVDVKHWGNHRGLHLLGGLALLSSGFVDLHVGLGVSL